MPRKPGLPAEQVPAVLSAFAAGEPIERIAKRFGFGASTIRRVLQREGAVPPAGSQRRGKLPPESDREIAQRRRAGESLAELAGAYGVSVRTIEERLRAQGVEAFEWLGADADRYVEMYQRGMSLSEIGRAMGVEHHTVAKWLERRGVRQREATGPAAPERAAKLGRTLGASERAEIVRLYRDERAGVDTIAARVGCSHTTAARILRAEGVTIRPQSTHGWSTKTRLRVAAFRKGRPRSPEWCQRIADGIARAQREGKMRTRSSKLEKAVAAALNDLGVTFHIQVPIVVGTKNNGRRRRYVFADFVIDGLGVIEVYGGYWHCDPRQYPNGPVTDAQREHAARDVGKQAAYASAGYRMVVIWESDIKAGAMAATRKALRTLETGSTASA